MRLIQGDCVQGLTTLESESVDLVLTDPPYNIARENNFHTMGRAGIDFGEWDKGFDLFSWMNELPRLLTKNGSVVIFNSWKNIGSIAKHGESLGLVTKDMIRWEKANPMPRNRDRRYIVDYEVAAWLVMPKAKWIFNRQSETYDRPLYKGSLTPKGEKLGHTTQKPLYLMKQLLLTHSNEGDVVLDPFMGSGTTGEACQQLDREFIGIELDEKYYQIAKQRLEI